MVPDMTINNPAIKEVFGSDELDIRPQGSAQLKFGLRYQHIDNPIVPERNRKTLAFDFDQDMQINATGKLGDRLDIKLNYDTKATFAFENKMKLNFTGLEDDIVKSLEMGDANRGEFNHGRAELVWSQRQIPIWQYHGHHGHG